MLSKLTMEIFNEIAKGTRDGNLYCLKCSTIIEEALILNSYAKTEIYESTIIWHHRLGHINV